MVPLNEDVLLMAVEGAAQSGAGRPLRDWTDSERSARRRLSGGVGSAPNNKPHASDLIQRIGTAANSRPR